MTKDEAKNKTLESDKAKVELENFYTMIQAAVDAGEFSLTIPAEKISQLGAYYLQQVDGYKITDGGDGNMVISWIEFAFDA